MRNFYLVLVLICMGAHAHAQNFKYGKVSEEEVLEKSHPKDPDANAAILYREHKTYYEINPSSGFTLVTNVRERVKIYNKDGLDWATKEIFYYQSGNDREKVAKIKGATYNLVGDKLEREKLRKDGIFEEEVSDYQVKTILTMPAVREGSVIEYEYTLRSPFITSIDMVPLQNVIPINRLEAQVTIPEYFGFKRHVNLKSELYFPIEETRKSDTYRPGAGSKLDFMQNIYSVTADDVPALKDEAYVDYLQNYAAFIKWELQYTKFPNAIVETFSETWEGIAKDIYNGAYSKEFGRDNYFHKEVDELLAGVTDPVEKAALIYDFVKQKVKWNEYLGFMPESSCKSAYKDGEGNVGEINLMLTSMLKYAGLKSNPVLVSTKNNGVPVFPTRNGFNYVISSVELPNGIILLDATDAGAGMGELPRRARNWQGRMIEENGNSAWVNLMPQKMSGHQSTFNIKMTDDLVLNGKAMSFYTGLEAKSYRDEFASLSLEEQIEQLESGKGNITISNVARENDQLPGMEVKESYEFELQNGLEMINGKVYLKPLLFEAMTENPFKADERHYPIFFDYPYEKSSTINIMIPEGYTVESLPESVISELNDGAGSYKFLVNLNNNFLRIQSVVEMKNIVYTPKDYEALKNFYALMVEKQAETVVLSKI
ncbi:DUF3857 domain-containing protein [Salinimicrobium sp. GXAS 041]|uniref:DUF3857 domain-containing protein n=1 Tax=Salinimicrobium sp. GXAS 041 TaxID=3400806 RepID=UPI003C7533F3